MDFFEGIFDSVKFGFSSLKNFKIWGLFAIGFAISFLVYLISSFISSFMAPIAQDSSTMEAMIAVFLKALVDNWSWFLLVSIVNILALLLMGFFVGVPMLQIALSSKKFKARVLDISSFWEYVVLSVKTFFLTILMIPNKLVSYAYIGFLALIVLFGGLGLALNSEQFSSGLLVAATGALVIWFCVFLFVLIYNSIRLSFSAPIFWSEKVDSKKAISLSLSQTEGKVLNIFFTQLFANMFYFLALVVIFALPIYGMTFFQSSISQILPVFLADLPVQFFELLRDNILSFIGIFILVNIFSLFHKGKKD